MSRLYNKPPLVETVCEFQFVGKEWDWTLPGLVYQEIKEKFPKKRQANVLEVELNAQEADGKPQLKGGSVARMQFLRADGSALVQIGPHLLAVNHLAPNPHWEDVKPLIFEMFETYQRIAHPAGFKRIGLRYINRIEIPEASFNFSDYFNFLPAIPKEIPASDFGSLFMRIELPYLKDNGRLFLTLGTAPDVKPETNVFILDLDFFTHIPSELALDGVQGWIETAHQHIETAFEACLTDKLRELFEETKP